MKKSMERMLKLVADFDAFCAPVAENEAAFDGDELNVAELDLIAAAGTIPHPCGAKARPKGIATQERPGPRGVFLSC